MTTTLRALCATLALTLAGLAQAETEIIPINYRMADEVLPLAQSVVGDRGRVAAYGNQLVVNAPGPVIDELRSVLGQLDSPPKRLLISIDTQRHGSAQQGGYQVDGRIGSGSVEIGTGRDHNSARIIRHDTQSRDGGVQQVQATEGYPALIQVGQSVPLNQWSTDAYGQVYQDTQYRDLMRGFYATANLVGDQVQVTISATNDRLSPDHSRELQLQNTDTRVSGRVGEWITLGGIDESASSSDRGVARRYSTHSAQDYSLRLKVDVLD